MPLKKATYSAATVHNTLLRKAGELGWPKHYKNDLYQHDWRFIRDNKPEAFVWVLRPAGTHLIPLLREATEKDRTWWTRWMDAIVNTNLEACFYVVTVHPDHSKPFGMRVNIRPVTAEQAGAIVHMPYATLRGAGL